MGRRKDSLLDMPSLQTCHKTQERILIMNETLMYLDTHLKSPKVSSIGLAYLNGQYDVHVFLQTGACIHKQSPTLAGLEEKIIIAYLGYLPDGA